MNVHFGFVFHVPRRLEDFLYYMVLYTSQRIFIIIVMISRGNGYMIIVWKVHINYKYSHLWIVYYFFVVYKNSK